MLKMERVLCAKCNKEVNGYLKEKCYFCKQIIGLDSWSSHTLNGEIRPHHTSCWHLVFRMKKKEYNQKNGIKQI